MGANGVQSAVYMFNATSGPFTVSVDGLEAWFYGGSYLNRTNVDLTVRIWNTAGDEKIFPIEPTTPLQTLNVPAATSVLPIDGTYYITVSGAGLDGSYSSYGSMGKFSLSLEYPTSADNQFAAAYR